MMSIKKYSQFVFVLLFAVFSTLTLAAEQTAQQVVQATVDTLLKDLNTNRAKYAKDPEAFHKALHTLLTPVVDVDGIARSVMTIKYARRATPEQMETFKANFEQGLMQFYGNALLDYEGKGMKVLKTIPSDSPDRVSVQTEVKGNDNTIYPVSYTMIKLNGKWMVRNVVVNGLNVGKLFRDQFASEMRNNKDDLNYVINDWADAVERAQEQADSDDKK
ncbi:toluene tolerance protein [Entomomonas moraniae]|uniref:Toluene tolerance protein n=1 Tax=Entomomonas moraniae TaxID=2213226 RepID=A0A3Q9JNL3_9GAMM|nr:ABC transporter substrate-binding protein [Entomomonas moraniae]AZS52142.1 toluene tolerance protein [Entomomonas moraniae]